MEGVVHYTIEYCSATKKNEVMPCAATRMDLEVITPSEVREKQVSYDTTSMWNGKHGTNELVYETKTASQTQSIDMWWPGGGGVV